MTVAALLVLVMESYEWKCDLEHKNRAILKIFAVFY